ncbi:MAG TPA: AMP-binding protein [Trebonia sp.]|nr:AMP-binding protein [Trebonia sp.]
MDTLPASASPARTSPARTSPEPSTVPACLRAAASDAPRALAIVDGDTRLTYAQLAGQAGQFTRALIAAGIGAGDAVALCAPNSARWVVAALGTLGAGAVLVPVNTRYKGGEAHYVLAKARAAALLVGNGFLGNDYLGMLSDADSQAPSAGPLASPASPGSPAPPASPGSLLPGLPSLRVVVDLGPCVPPRARSHPAGPDAELPRGGVPGGGVPGSSVPGSGVSGSGVSGSGVSRAALSLAAFLRAGDAIDQAAAGRRAGAVTPGALCDVIFTSGTSGRPKGVMTSHATALRNAAAWADGMGMGAGDRYLIVNPFFHTFGYRAGILACLAARATMYPLAVFDVEAALAIAQAERITVLPGPPTLFRSILAHPAHGDFDLSVRLVATGAASVPRALMERIRDELGVAFVASPYGLTEVGGTATMPPPGAPAEKVLTTVGTAIPGTEIAIGGRDGQHQPAGVDGEILIRGYHVMRGYFDDPRATGEAIDSGGWLHTGDVGHLDADGYLTVTGRLTEVFQVGGFNVYPVEVEQLLATHPLIAEAAVIGVPDERLGEVGHAFVVARPGCLPDPQEVIAFARERIANFKVPRAVTIAADLPRTPLGKVRKFMLPRVSPPGAGGPGASVAGTGTADMKPGA